MLETEAGNREPEERRVLCAKCEDLNPRGNSECRRCGSHLYVSCVDCGHRNERLRTRCTSCGRRLHRNLLQRYKKKLFPGRSKISPLQVFVFVLGIGLVFGLIVFISTVRIPEFW